MRRAAPTNATVLITGESGVGKELVARAIHRNSLRKDEAFVQVNCAAIPEELIESELFGHEKGSFTGATEKQIGKFELAHKGTIFLDEVGDMSLRTQAKVLRVLQEGEVERIGSQKTIQVDVRVIAATNRGLEDEIEQGALPRGPLLPPLGAADPRAAAARAARGRRSRSSSTSCASSARRTTSRRRPSRRRRSTRCASHSWRGNVRELKNAIERLLIMVEGDEITPEDLADVLRRPAAREEPVASGARRARNAPRLQGGGGARLPGPEAAGQRLEHLRHGGRDRHAALEPVQEARGLRHQPGEGRLEAGRRDGRGSELGLPGLNRLRGHAQALLLALVAQLVLGLALWQGYTLASNRLQGGAWIVTKTTLERGLSGAQNFLNGRQSVAGQRLNLGAWYGYQEIIYRKPLRPARIECSFQLHSRAHLSLIFGKTQAGFSGVRVSLDPARPSMLFVASPLGEFVERTPLAIPKIERRTVHRLAVAFAPGAVTVAIDGAALGQFPVRLAEWQQVGFRGGGRPAIVDDIVIQARGSGSVLQPAASIYESFDSAGTWPAAIVWVALVLLANIVYLVARLARPAVNVREALLSVIVANGALSVMAASVVLFLWFRTERYPAADSALKAGENAWKVSQADEIREAIRRKYANPAAAGVTRLLFLGTSQTWGAGAAHEGETITAVLEKMLNEGESAGHRYECINGAISAMDSAVLLRLYEREWMKLRPKLLVVNLSNNDTDANTLRSNLRRMAQLSRASGGRTLFVQEPNSSEVLHAAFGAIDVRHAAMKEAGELEGVPVLDMHAFLLANEDRGFLFWDPVHLTSLGQRLFAERLYPEVRRLLGEAAPPPAADVTLGVAAPDVGPI